MPHAYQKMSKTPPNPIPVEIIEVEAPIGANRNITPPYEEEEGQLQPIPPPLPPLFLRIELPTFKKVELDDPVFSKGRMSMWKIEEEENEKNTLIGGFGKIEFQTIKSNDLNFHIIATKTARKIDCTAIVKEQHIYKSLGKSSNILKMFGSGYFRSSPSHGCLALEPGSIALSEEIENRGIIGKNFNLNQALKIMLAIAQGLDELHRKNYVHLDVKASNVLVVMRKGAPQIVICDFGGVAGFNGENVHRTPVYRHHNLLDQECDYGAVLLIGLQALSSLAEVLWWSKSAARNVKNKIKELEALFLNRALGLKMVTALLAEDDNERKLAHLQARRVGLKTILKQGLALIGSDGMELGINEFTIDLKRIERNRETAAQLAAENDEAKQQFKVVEVAKSDDRYFKYF